jgi:hypothetical protein
MTERLPLRIIARILGAAALILCGHSTNLAETQFHLSPDPRFVRLERFFNRYGCQAPHHIGDYLRAADFHGLDYRLLPALSIRETHCGLADRHNNHWGYHPGRQSFPSIAAGIEFVAQQLAENPPYRGKSLQEKLFTYNPLPAYPEEVKYIMRQIEWAPLTECANKRRGALVGQPRFGHTTP